MLLDPITPENIYVVRNKQRNPNIARILTGYGYAEQIGEGMQLFKREYDKHPFKTKYPQYREWIDTTITILYPVEISGPKAGEVFLEGLNERQKTAIEYLKAKGTISRKEYVTLTNISLRQANKDLNYLLSKGLIVQSGKGRSVKYTMHD